MPHLARKWYFPRHRQLVRSNLSPYAGLQFLVKLTIDKRSQALTVDLKDINGTSVFSKPCQLKQRTTAIDALDCGTVCVAIPGNCLRNDST